jgi:hypothetical protein
MRLLGGGGEADEAWGKSKLPDMTGKLAGGGGDGGLGMGDGRRLCPWTGVQSRRVGDDGEV